MPLGRNRRVLQVVFPSREARDIEKAAKKMGISISSYLGLRYRGYL